MIFLLYHLSQSGPVFGQRADLYLSCIQFGTVRRLLKQKCLRSLRALTGKPLVTAVTSFRRCPCIYGDAVYTRRSVQIMDDMIHLPAVIQIGRIDVYAVDLIINREFLYDRGVRLFDNVSGSALSN